MEAAGKDAHGQRLALSALLLGAMGTAFAPILVRTSELAPTATAFHRMALAIPMMALWLAVAKRRDAWASTPPTARDYWMLAATGLFFAGDLIALHWSIALTSVANAVLFLNSQPVFVVLGAWILFRERVSVPFLLGLAVTLIGAVILMGTSFTLSADRLVGDVLGVLSGIFYAAYILVTVRLRARFASLPIMMWTCVAASPILLAAAWISGESVIPETARGWSFLIALAFIGQVAGNGLIVYAFAHLPASFSAVGLLSQPVMAALFAWALLGEPLGPLAVFGMAVVLAGIFVCRQASRAPTP
jgi:drug/metabolite transporter (DMT)-like permease